jgi:septum formation topological specificity factor MinE
MKFSELLREALRSAASGLDDKTVEALRTEITTLIRAWVEIHEPDDEDVDPQEPQRVLILQLLEELEDRSEIPIVE